MVIYVDESGDLGFGKTGASRYFLIGAMVANKAKDFSRPVKQAREKIVRAGFPHDKELKWAHTLPEERKIVLEHLARRPLKFHPIAIDKSQVDPIFNTPKMREILYTLCAVDLLVPLLHGVEEAYICADIRQQKIIHYYRLQHLLENRLLEDPECPNPDKVTFEYKDSHLQRGLCAVDFYCGAVARAWGVQFHDLRTEEYLNIIRQQVSNIRRTFYKPRVPEK